MITFRFLVILVSLHLAFGRTSNATDDRAAERELASTGEKAKVSPKVANKKQAKAKAGNSEVDAKLWLLKRHGLSIDLPEGPGWKVALNNIEFRYAVVNKSSQKAIMVYVQANPRTKFDEEYIRELEQLALKHSKGRARIVQREELELGGAPAYQYELAVGEASSKTRTLTRYILANTREYKIDLLCKCEDVKEDEELAAILNGMKLLGTGKEWEQDFVNPGEDPSMYRYKPTKKDLEFLEKLKRDVEGG